MLYGAAALAAVKAEAHGKARYAATKRGLKLRANGQTGQTGRTGQTGQTGQTGRTGQTGQTGRTGRTVGRSDGACAKPQGIEQPEPSRKPQLGDCSRQTPAIPQDPPSTVHRPRQTTKVEASSPTVAGVIARAFGLLMYMARIWDQWRKSNPSGKVPLIIPLVFYQGDKPWPKDTSVLSQVQIPKTLRQMKWSQKTGQVV